MVTKPKRTSEKTAKIVWARAGGMCSYPGCLKHLIVSPVSPNDPPAVLGHIAHIVGHSEDGPRGEEVFRGIDRDSAENLLLLCTEHHTLIDQQPESYPTSWLYQVKDKHERWVRERLSANQPFLQSSLDLQQVYETLAASNIQAFGHDVFAEFRAVCRPNTIKRHDYDLRAFSTFLSSCGIQRLPETLASDPAAWRGMTYGILAAFRRGLEERGEAVGTIKARIATIHQYCRLAGPPPEGAGVLSGEELAAILSVKGYNGKAARNLDEDRVRRGIPTRVGTKKAHFTAITESQAEKLKRTTTPPPPPQRFPREHDQLLAARDALMLCLLVEHALRCGELVALDVESIDLDRCTLSIYSEKTHASNVHELQEHTEAAARVYLTQLGRNTGALFTGYKDKRITTRAVNKRVGVLGKILGITQKQLSPHDLRHFFTFDALEHGLSLDLVQGIGGWTSPYMPLLYAKRSIVRTWKIERKKQRD
jgi:integrase